jgi:hypothetical protein
MSNCLKQIGNLLSVGFYLGCILHFTSCPASAADRYLLLDSRIIAFTDNVCLVPGNVNKDPGNPLFTEEYWADPPKIWEARYDNLYPNVIYDSKDNLFKIWYKSFIRDASSETIPVKDRPNHKYSTAAAGRQRGILYAWSEDGIDWIKPTLGLVEFMGSADNNIVQLNFEGGVFKDKHESDPVRRFKMFGRIDRPERHMAIAFSEDGIRWTAPRPWPEHNVQGDAHNNALWAPGLDRYVGITRVWADKQRIVVRTESDDFINWIEPKEILRGEGVHEQIYSMPVFYYANVYIGLPSILNADDTVDTELAWSPDTREWHRISPGYAIIPRGKNIDNYPDSDYDAGCVYASVPVFTNEEVLIYYGGSNHYHTDWREGSLNLARMRPDGFAGFEVKDAAGPGMVRTNNFTVTGSEFNINADITDGGSLRVAVLDENGHAITGYTFADCMAITSNAIDAPVEWNGNDLSSLIGEKVAFQFMFENGIIYSFSGNLNFVENEKKSLCE